MRDPSRRRTKLSRNKSNDMQYNTIRYAIRIDTTNTVDHFWVLETQSVDTTVNYDFSFSIEIRLSLSYLPGKRVTEVIQQKSNSFLRRKARVELLCSLHAVSEKLRCHREDTSLTHFHRSTAVLRRKTGFPRWLAHFSRCLGPVPRPPCRSSSGTAPPEQKRTLSTKMEQLNERLE